MWLSDKIRQRSRKLLLSVDFKKNIISGVANNVMNAARRLPQVPEATTNGHGFFSKFFGKKDQQPNQVPLIKLEKARIYIFINWLLKEGDMHRWPLKSSCKCYEIKNIVLFD